MAVAEAGTDLHLHPPALIAVLSTLVVLDLAEEAWSRARDVGPALVLAHSAVDLVGLTVVLLLSGGPHNPLTSTFLVYVALLAVVLPARGAWAATGAAMVLEAVVVLVPSTLSPLPHVHLLGHVATFVLASIAVTWVVSRVSGALRAREVREARAERERATTERLAALGRLAAGVAHELGTPLGTIQLLVEGQVDEGGDPTAQSVLVQVERCRTLLDRLRGRDGVVSSDCRPEITAWVNEWRRAAPEVEVEVVDEARDRVSGSEESWRGALWVTLDNARRAGARHIRVAASCPEPGQVEVVVADDGAGLTADDADRGGEPFRSGWGGTGLGLFVARSFAESVGGSVTLAPGEGGGAVAVLRMRAPT